MSLGLTEEQIAERRSGIGASEIAAVCGLSPWQSPLDVWLRKTGRDPETGETNEYQHWGHVLEPVVAEEFTRRTGKKVRRWAKAYRKGVLMAHVDRIVEGTDQYLECKTANSFATWAKEDELPEYYEAQCQQIAYCSARPSGYLAALVGGQRYVAFEVQSDVEAQVALAEVGERFWRDHVEKDIPPSPTTVNDIDRLYGAGGADEEAKIVTSDRADSLLRQLRDLKALIKKNEGQATKIEVALKDFIGLHSTLVDAGGKPLATWKPNRPSARTNWEFVAREMAGKLAATPLMNEMISAYSAVRPGPRVLRLKINKEF